jgi:hypothetical protein
MNSLSRFAGIGRSAKRIVSSSPEDTSPSWNSRNSPSGESIQGGYLGAEDGKPIRRSKVTTIKVEIKEQKGGMAISLEMEGSENPSQSEMMLAIVVRSKIEEALKSITSDMDDEGNFLRFLMSVMSKNGNDEDKEGEEHPASLDWVMEELEKIENALCKEGKE